MKQKTVGKRFSKREISTEELERIKRALPESLDRKTLMQEVNDFENGENQFYHLLDKLKQFFESRMKLWSLPFTPYLYPIKSGLQMWQSKPPEGFKEDSDRKKITLDRYILHHNYEHDSKEHLAAKAIVKIHKIENIRRGSSIFLKEVILPFLLFELGKTCILFEVYEKDYKQHKEIGKQRTNRFREAWEEFGQRLVKENPEKSQKWIWQNRIPMSSSKDEEPDDLREPNAPDSLFIYRYKDDDNEEKIIAKSDVTGKVERPMNFHSFRTQYLKKNPKKPKQFKEKNIKNYPWDYIKNS